MNVLFFFLIPLALGNMGLMTLLANAASVLPIPANVGRVIVFVLVAIVINVVFPFNGIMILLGFCLGALVRNFGVGFGNLASIGGSFVATNRYSAAPPSQYINTGTDDARRRRAQQDNDQRRRAEGEVAAAAARKKADDERYYDDKRRREAEDARKKAEDQRYYDEKRRREDEDARRRRDGR